MWINLPSNGIFDLSYTFTLDNWVSKESPNSVTLPPQGPSSLLCNTGFQIPVSPFSCIKYSGPVDPDMWCITSKHAIFLPILSRSLFHDFYSENRFQCQDFEVFLKTEWDFLMMWNGSNFVRRRFITRKAIHLHPVLVLSPMLNVGCGLWGSIPHLHKYSFYWQKNDQHYNSFCISEHHNIYPAELLASVPQQEIPFQLCHSPRLLQSLQPHARSLPYKHSAVHRLAVGLITRA